MPKRQRVNHWLLLLQQVEALVWLQKLRVLSRQLNSQLRKRRLSRLQLSNLPRETISWTFSAALPPINNKCSNNRTQALVS